MYYIQYNNIAAGDVVIAHLDAYLYIFLNTDNSVLVTADFISCLVSPPVYNTLGYTERDFSHSC